MQFSSQETPEWHGHAEEVGGLGACGRGRGQVTHREAACAIMRQCSGQKTVVSFVRIRLGIQGPGGPLWPNASLSPQPTVSPPSHQPEQASNVGLFPRDLVAWGWGWDLTSKSLQSFCFFSVVCVPNPHQSHQSLRWYSTS